MGVFIIHPCLPSCWSSCTTAGPLRSTGITPLRVFQNVEELRCALAEFRHRYNRRWIVQRLGYLTPAQARQQLLALRAAA
jgi:transposase InsO family protein